MVRPVHGLVSSYNCSFYCLNPDLYYRDCDIVMLGMEHGKVCVATSASKSSIRRFVITEKAPTWAFPWLKVATTAFTFKTLLRHYAERLTPRSLNVKLGS